MIGNEFQEIESTSEPLDTNVISVLDYDLDGAISKIEGLAASYSTDPLAGFPLIENYRVDVSHPGEVPGKGPREYGFVSIRNHRTGHPQCYIPFGGNTKITLLQAVCRVIAYELIDSKTN